MSKRMQNYKAAIYLRFGSEVCASFEELKRERQKRIAMNRMKPEQIEFCEKMKKELKIQNCISSI